MTIYKDGIPYNLIGTWKAFSNKLDFFKFIVTCKLWN